MSKPIPPPYDIEKRWANRFKRDDRIFGVISALIILGYAGALLWAVLTP